MSAESKPSDYSPKEGDVMKLTHAAARIALLFVAVAMLSLSALAQERKITAKDVPAAVIAAFKSAYPQATIRGYAKEKENGKVFYEVESIEGQTHRDILYNPDGTVAEVEEGIAIGDLPAGAREAMLAMHPKAVVTSAEKITRDGI